MSHTYTPEELASLARKVGAKSITVTGPDIADDEAPGFKLGDRVRVVDAAKPFTNANSHVGVIIDIAGDDENPLLVEFGLNDVLWLAANEIEAVTQ